LSDQRPTEFQWNSFQSEKSRNNSASRPTHSDSFSNLFDRRQHSQPTDGFVDLVRPFSDESMEDRTSTVSASDLEETEQQAYEKGFAKGEADGFGTGLKKATELVERFQKIIEQSETLWDDLVKRNEKQILELVCRAVEKTAYTTAILDHETVRHALLEAFSVIPEPEEVTLHISPDDYEFVETVKADLFKQFKGLDHVTVISDPGVAPGGCSIRSRSGQVNTGVEQRLEAVRQSIIQAYEHQNCVLRT